MSGVLPVFENLNYKLQRGLPDKLLIIESDMIQYVVPSSRRVTRRQVCDTLQALAPTNVKMINQTSLLYIESNLDQLGLLSSTHGQRSQQQNRQTTSQSVLINTPKFLNATHHTEIRRIELPRSMVKDL